MKSNGKAKLPQHVALIMDGNGRWARRRGLMRKFGHREGVKTLIRLAKHLFAAGVGYVTVYAFSTENQYRPPDEVSELISLIRRYFKTTFREFVDMGIHVRSIGDETYFPPDVVGIIRDLSKDSEGGGNGVFTFALNYGGRQEIVQAVNRAVTAGQTVDEAAFSRLLYTDGIPEPDLILRTGGEKRLSNFLLFQSAYAELFFTDTLWPDFSNDEMDKILTEYGARNRRFGRVQDCEE